MNYILFFGFFFFCITSPRWVGYIAKHRKKKLLKDQLDFAYFEQDEELILKLEKQLEEL